MKREVLTGILGGFLALLAISILSGFTLVSLEAPMENRELIRRLTLWETQLESKFNSSGYLTLDATDQILFGTNILAISGTNIQYNGRSL